MKNLTRQNPRQLIVAQELINKVKSKCCGIKVYKDEEAMTLKFDPINLIDLTISYKINCKKVSHTIAFEGINILQNETPYAQHYDFGTRQIRDDKSGISLPNLFYRLDF